MDLNHQELGVGLRVLQHQVALRSAGGKNRTAVDGKGDHGFVQLLLKFLLALLHIDTGKGAHGGIIIQFQGIAGGRAKDDHPNKDQGDCCTTDRQKPFFLFYILSHTNLPPYVWYIYIFRPFFQNANTLFIQILKIG